MRIVDEHEQLEDALAAARREAMSGFHDDRVFLERYIARVAPRRDTDPRRPSTATSCT